MNNKKNIKNKHCKHEFKGIPGNIVYEPCIKCNKSKYQITMEMILQGKFK